MTAGCTGALEDEAARCSAEKSAAFVEDTLPTLNDDVDDRGLLGGRGGGGRLRLVLAGVASRSKTLAHQEEKHTHKL